jgi:hypothetical protein
VTLLASRFLSQRPVDCSDPDVLAVTVLELEDRRDRLISQEQFLDAVRAQSAIDSARTLHLNVIKERTRQTAAQAVFHKKDVYNFEYSQFSANMENVECDIESKLDDQKRRLVEKQERERVEHDRAWQVEPKQRRFNRASKRLRFLRLQQTLLANAGRFEEADDVLKIGDAVEAWESAEKHHNLSVAYCSSRRLLDEKHAAEMDTFERAADVKRGEFRYMRDAIARRFANRAAALEIEEKQVSGVEPLWTIKHRNDGDQIRRSTGEIRTGKAMGRRVNVADFNTLQLPPLPVGSGIRPTTPRSVRPVRLG